jgi:hypothetical protein
MFRADRDLLTVPQYDRLRQVADPKLRPLKIPDQRNRPADPSSTSRTRRALRIVPVRAGDRLSRAASMSAATSSRSFSDESDAGPRVA